MFKFVIGFVLGAIALAYYPMYIDDVKTVTNDAAKAVVDATSEPTVIDKAKDLVK